MGEVPGLPPHTKFHHHGFRNVDLNPPKWSKYGTFYDNNNNNQIYIAP